MRRGEGYDLGRMIPYMIATVLVIAFVFYIMYSNFIGAQAVTVQHTTDMENLLIVKELYYSPNCFIYEDDLIGRAYPGIIDLAKFYYRDEILDSSNCLKYFERDVRVTIGGLSSGKIIEDPLVFTKSVLTFDGITYEQDEMIIEIERGETYIEQAWAN